MRPTNLGFRSPKERTAEYNYPNVTFDGRSLPYLHTDNHHSSMPTSKRFSLYESLARRTSATVGPGSYNVREEPLEHWNISGTPKIRPYHAIKDPTSNAYLFVGNQMVYDSSLVKKSRRSSVPTSETSEIKPARNSSTTTPKKEANIKQDTLEKMKNSPYLGHRNKNNPIIG